MEFSQSIFASRFNITKQDLEGYLAEALSQGGDYADLYFEYLLTSSISIDESMVKSAAQGVSMGVGIRVIPENAPDTPTAMTFPRKNPQSRRKWQPTSLPVPVRWRSSG